ncbi:MAG TPA: hypothetical protein VJ951_04585 [Bacteroidales bacterium]|nr:hypothetical protein [Bacteroidales bacterium]
MKRFDFDTILFPFHYTSWYAGNFGPQVLEMARQKEMGIMALKAMAKHRWPKGMKRADRPFSTWYVPLHEEDEARKGLRFSLSHPIATAIPPGDSELFSLALKLAKDFKPMNDDEIMEMKKMGLEERPLFKYPQG